MIIGPTGALLGRLTGDLWGSVRNALPKYDCSSASSTDDRDDSDDRLSKLGEVPDTIVSKGVDDLQDNSSKYDDGTDQR